MDRRDFLISSAATGLSVIAKPSLVFASDKKIDFANEPKRIRKAFYDLTDEEVRNLCRAISYMRNNYPLEHPLQWDNYGTVHAMHCTEAGPAYPAVHWSWNFLPWHRGYLFCLERILANILTTKFNIDGTKFALPYWDWTTQKTMPNTKERIERNLASPYFGYDLTQEDMTSSDNLGFDNSALYDGNRGPTLLKPDMDPANEDTEESAKHIEECLHYMSEDYVRLMLSVPFEQFGGKSTVDRQTGQGLLEQGPHNDGHDWVGSRIGKNRTMGTLRAAAKDPIFYAHHACIDRIWSLYTNPQPDPQGDWGQQEYNFYDIDGSLITLSNQDIIENVTNITYQPSSQSKTILTAAKRPLKATKATTISVMEHLNGNPISIPVPSDFFGNHDTVLVDFVLGNINDTEKYSISIWAEGYYIGKINWLDGDHRIHNKNIDHTFTTILSGLKNTGDHIVLVPPKKNYIDVLVKSMTYKVL